MGGFSVEFEEEGQFCYMHVRFWKKNTLCKVRLSRFARSTPMPIGYFTTMSRLLSFISVRPDLVACSGSPLDVFETFDSCKIFAKGLQGPFRFESLDLSRLMHRHSFSVFGRLDFFAVLEHLIISLGGALESPWIVDLPELAKVFLILLRILLRFFRVLAVLFWDAFQVASFKTLKICDDVLCFRSFLSAN